MTNQDSPVYSSTFPVCANPAVDIISNLIGCGLAGGFTCEKIDISYQLSNHAAYKLDQTGYLILFTK